MINWQIEARLLASCNCDYSCPCQFNALPTYGNCDAVVGLDIDRGHFGSVKLDGVEIGDGQVAVCPVSTGENPPVGCHPNG